MEDAVKNNKMMQDIRFTPDIGVQSNQTRLDGNRVMLDQLELLSVQPALDRLNQEGYNLTIKNVFLEDTVLPLGTDDSMRLVSVSAGLPNSTALYLVKGTQATKRDDYEMYRKKDNPDGSYWVTSAQKYSEAHHYHWTEKHLLHINKDGNTQLMNERLGAKALQVLSTPDDGSVIVLASQEDSAADDIARDIYRIGPDGTVTKQYGSVKGNVYADGTGEVYMLNTADNRITKLGSGESVRLTEKMIFLASRGKPQQLEASHDHESPE
ncbi:hypothetical protein ACFQI7_02785 [Paenibacillus allorhizosphaerae]|uniref:Lipoprotein n=1 Tax=Paenibacillus allorhizosphaerae TaxID=2849866 RepID=A0ABM8VBS0_9BACL|nr:hypothetical protein [Paenibacillus allorhizosphaerae]CAG7618455.1 hypothetical protein PAECIP111802_00519 [Paenibacillus allorhizosphaerae]